MTIYFLCFFPRADFTGFSPSLNIFSNALKVYVSSKKNTINGNNFPYNIKFYEKRFYCAHIKQSTYETCDPEELSFLAKDDESDENEDESDKDWQDALKEAVCLHHYWMVERTQDDEKYQMLHNITNSKKTEEEYIKAINICADFSKAVDDKEDDMLSRLIKIRRFLWC